MSVKDALFSGSREQVIPEETFLAVFEDAAAGVLALRGQVREGHGREWSRQFVSRLIREAYGLRTVLNDYDAQENRTFSIFTEIVAGIRGFGHVSYILKHLKERFHRSPFAEPPSRLEGFLEESSETLLWCGNTLRVLFGALLEECEKLEVRLPEIEPVKDDEGGVPVVRPHLPHNIDEEELSGEGSMVAQVASSFLRFSADFEALEAKELDTYIELKEFVLGKLDEERARKLETSVHAIQSKYDTYVQFTGSEAKDPDLKRLRTVISLILHLLEVTTHLVHFYERHENDIRSQEAKDRVAGIVDKKMVLDRAVNYAIQYASRLVAEGVEISHRLIPDYTSIRELTFEIPEGVRLHIRPAALIAGIVSHHGTPVKMRMGDDECDAGSVTDVIFLAGTNIEATEVTFLGDERPLADLAVLFSVGLEDSGREDLEKALPYLNFRR